MIAITGATGKVGTRLVPQLLEAGEDVRVICRDVERARATFGDDVETSRGDLDEPDSVTAALDGVERAFLLVPAGPRQLSREGHLIQAAMRAGVRRVVKLSVLAADERSPVQLARWHRQAETELASAGLGYTRRSSIATGPMPRIARCETAPWRRGRRPDDPPPLGARAKATWWRTRPMARACTATAPTLP
jgi:uncharacterized protein YbjT (DUF2867 family)